jgi:lipopolysaccharide transport system permease protein
MKNKDGLKIYEPDAQLKRGWFSLWRDMINEMISSRELIWRLFLRDFMAKYKQAVFGFLWAIIMPLTIIGGFSFLNKAGLFNIGRTDIPYPAFALLSLSVYQLFARGLGVASNSIIDAGAMVVKINFAKESLVIASFAQAVFEFLIQLGLLVIIFFVYRIVPSWKIIFFPLTLVPLIFLTIGLGFIFSLLAALMRDIPNMITLLTTFLLLLTPVLYPPQTEGPLAILAGINPLAILINGARDIVIKGYLSQPLPYFLASFFSLFIFAICWQIFHLVEPRIAERV